MINKEKVVVYLTFSCAFMILLFHYIAFGKATVMQKFDTSDRLTLNILFIGNSYVFFNDMPHILQNLARSDPSAAFNVETEMLVEGGATLAYFLNSRKAQSVIESKEWDYIVMQPQSEWANNNSRIRNTEAALSLWRKRIKQNGTRLVFFMTWARQDRVGWYQSSNFSQFKNHRAMYNRINKHSVSLVKKYDMMLAPIGAYWQYALGHYPDLNLYDRDGSHPSSEGSFLIALVFYKMLVDSTIEDITYWPRYINMQEKKAVLELVSKKF
ncbi:MAG: DUF4886 domain-containing protein [Alphaproteobacteria bacterium]